MAPEIRIELILTDSKSAVLPLHNSGIKSIQMLKNILLWSMPKQKTLDFLGLGFVKIFLLKNYLHKPYRSNEALIITCC
jgi:hypothetical protein